MLRFAAALRGKGIDVWIDRWEMLPGDGLIQKIFEEGLKNASAVVVVLSRYSISKPWVREELDAAAVKRINFGSKLIPVVLDDCEVPQVLQATLWEPAADLNNIENVVDRVAAVIFNHRPKPPIGLPPVYSAPTYSSFPGLSATDTYVFVESAKWTIDEDEHIVDPTKMFLQSAPPTISKDLLIESIDMLEQHGYVKVSRHLGAGPYNFRVNDRGIELYLSNQFPEYDALVRRVIGLLVNEQMTASDSIATRVEVPHRVAKHILAQFEDLGHLRLGRTLGSVSQVLTISASLRRMLAR